jgi:hypothetical protein
LHIVGRKLLPPHHSITRSGARAGVKKTVKTSKNLKKD